MSEGPEENTNVEAFGLPIDRFEAAVDALVELRDMGKLLIFLTRRGAVKLVGDIKDFQQEFSTRANDPSINLEQSKDAQDEIRRLTYAVIRISNADAILDFLEQFYWERLRPEQEQTQKEEFRKRQELKINIISKRIVTEALRQRSSRLATATSACIEELDCEVVSEREDWFRERKINNPFLRMRLRYSDGFKGDVQYFLLPFEMLDSNAAASFEFECDLADIDLLLKRLNDAKQRLLKLQEQEIEREVR